MISHVSTMCALQPYVMKYDVWPHHMTCDLSSKQHPSPPELMLFMYHSPPLCLFSVSVEKQRKDVCLDQRRTAHVKWKKVSSSQFSVTQFPLSFIKSRSKELHFYCAVCNTFELLHTYHHRCSYLCRNQDAPLFTSLSSTLNKI